MDPIVLGCERERLAYTIACLKREMAEIDRKFISGIEAADELSEESVRRMLERRFRQIGLARTAPYFARIDFSEAQRPPRTVYFGKTTVYDKNAEIVVADWRAPVATLYYECRLGDAAYDCPEGRIEGELRLKRQLEIKDGELLGYADVDIISDDELLQPYLRVSADERLKNIIATIQSEQNRIIRADMFRPLIVQGVAGSGKTTVALHRIAYLVYTYAEKFKPERFMVLAPGGYFLKYISGVLPDLGVEDVPQLTVEQLVRDITKAKFRLIEPADFIDRGVESDTSEAYARAAAYKSSRQALEDIDAFLRDEAARFMPADDFVLSVGTVMTHAQIREFLEANDHRLSLFERLDTLRHRLEHMVSDYEGGKKAAARWIKTVKKPAILTLYSEFLKRLPVEYQMPQDKRNTLYYEDLAPLLYMHCRVYGAKDKQMRHIVVDEAQDFPPTLFWLLQDIFPNATFTLFGDLAQRIYVHRGMPDWDSVSDMVWDGRASVVALQKSYRTTVEIMAQANRILRFLPAIPPGEAVIRHGDPVRMLDVWGVRGCAETILARVEAHRGAGHKNIAIIARDGTGCHALAKELRAIGFADFALIHSRDQDFAHGISLLPAALSKGLEFDAVIVADASNYGRNELDAHLLYVAMTRAMHALDILYEGEPPVLLA